MQRTNRESLLIFTVAVASLILSSIAVCSAHPSRGSSRSQEKPPYMIGMMGAMSDWLNRLHSLLVEEPTKPSKPGVTVSRPVERFTSEPVVMSPSSTTDVAVSAPTPSPGAASSSAVCGHGSGKCPTDGEASTSATVNNTTTSQAQASNSTVRNNTSSSEPVKTTPHTPSEVHLSIGGLWRARKFSKRAASTWVTLLDNVFESDEKIKRVAVDAPSGGVLVSSYGTIIGRKDTKYFQGRFIINGMTTTFNDSWGAFYISGGEIESSAPFCFTQMHGLPTDNHSVSVNVQANYSTAGSFHIGGLMAVTFPRPAFLSSIRAESETGLSNQKPHYQTWFINLRLPRTRHFSSWLPMDESTTARKGAHL